MRAKPTVRAYSADSARAAQPCGGQFPAEKWVFSRVLGAGAAGVPCSNWRSGAFRAVAGARVPTALDPMKTLTVGLLTLIGGPPAFAQTSEDVDADFARLIPKESVLLVRLTSTEELLPPVERVRASLMPAGAPWKAVDLLAALEIPANVALIDPQAPLGFTLAVSRERPIPTPVYVLGTLDPEAFVASLAPPWRERARVSGGYVGVALSGAYEPGEGSEALLRGLPEGLLVARIDFQRLIEAYRPLIDLGLLQAESTLDAPQGHGALDVRNFMQSFFDLAVAFLDSAERLDVVVEVRGARAKISGALDTVEGSVLSTWGRPEEVDYAGLARRLDPESAIQVVSTFDTSEYTHQVLTAYGSILEYSSAAGHLPEPFGDAGRAALEVLGEIRCHVGRTTLSSLDFGPPGPRGAFFYESSSPEELARGLERLLELPDLAPLGVVPGGGVPLEIGGAKVVRRVASFDLDAFAAALPDARRPSDEHLLAVQDALDRIVPEGLQVALGTVPGPAPGDDESGWALCVVGGDEAYLRKAVERFSAADPAADSVWAPAISGLKGANPGGFFRYDVPRALAGVQRITAALGVPGAVETSALEGISFRLMGWAGIDGATWRGGLALDLDELARFLQRMGG
jgi:hypothetical protein